ncbi:MAG TPA: hypothetical protein VJU34_09760 [Phenylobacterium sp.]|nr:hypothetical protein [Phenylobacterium sp.]
MKLLVGVTVCLALVAGSAVAQGTFNSGRKSGFGAWSPKPNTSASPYGGSPHSSPYGVPSYGSSDDGAPASRYKPKIYGAPEPPKAPGFEPYKPFKAGSVYGRPSGAGGVSGAKDCERSVYINACR